MKIYLAKPITGESFEDVVRYYENLSADLFEMGYETLCPMTAKGYLRTEIEFKAHGFDNPVSTNHAIFERDKWMIEQSDVIFVNLHLATRVSIGCMMELAWASLLGKHTVVIMGQAHKHAFVFEAADIVFEDYDEAANGELRNEISTMS
jgi:nucleoside 2-deoxyribosyltransferase